MVYDIDGAGKAKLPRQMATGRLIGIQSGSKSCEVFDRENGDFSWVRLSLVVGKDKEGKDVFFNATVYDVHYSLMKELGRADALLLEKKHPIVQFEYYTSPPKLALDETGQPKTKQTVKMIDGKEVLVNDPVFYINNRLSKEDAINTFRILVEDDPAAAKADAPIASKQKPAAAKTGAKAPSAAVDAGSDEDVAEEEAV
jgi:hypothetical protein